MKKINRKTVLVVLLIILLISTVVSLVVLENMKKDLAFMETWKISTEREGFIDKVSRYYFPFELLAYVIGGYFMYMIFYGWSNELFDGKLFKTIPYFILSILGGIYSLHCYTEVSKVRAILGGKGIIPPASMLIKPFLIAMILGLIVYVIKNSIEKEFYKEANDLKGSKYYNDWIDMSEKVKKIV